MAASNSNVYTIPITEREAYALADMDGVKCDLRTVAVGCRRIAPILDGSTPLEYIFDVDGFPAALTRYGRCFKSGARSAFNLQAQQWIEELSPELRQVHEDAIALRDKHIAHSVNDWEINQPIARVRFEEGKPPEVLSVEMRLRFTPLPLAEFVLSLAELASALADRVETACEEEKKRVLQFVRQLPAEELLRRRNTLPRVPAQGDPAKPRKRS